MSLVFYASKNISFNDDNHILKFFTEGFENLPPSFIFNSENLLSSIEQSTWLHLYFPFGKFHLDIHNKMADNNGTALPNETDFDISMDRFCWTDIFIWRSEAIWRLSRWCYVMSGVGVSARRYVPSVSAITCWSDFPCFSFRTPSHSYSIAWVFLSR